MSPDWRELLDRMLDGEELAPHEAAALREALSDPLRRQEAVRQLRFRHALAEELSCPAVDDPASSRDRLLAKVLLREKAEASRPPERRSGWRAAVLPRVWLPVAIAAAALIAIGVCLLMRGSQRQEPTASGDLAVYRDGQVVAAGGGLRPGDRVVAGERGGELALGGYCRLALAPHAEVVLQSRPSSQEVELRSGTLTSRVEPARGGFTCRTPLGAIRVVGTEFVTTVNHLSLHNGEGPMRKSALVTVVVLSGAVAFDLAGQSGLLAAGESKTFGGQPVAGEVARLAILGTGAPEGTVALFGHGFPKGMLKRDDALSLKRVDTGALLRTQVNPVTSWPDGSVKVAVLAVECPAVEKGQALECVLVKGAQPDAGQPLDLAAALKGRKAAITITPREGKPWTLDLLAGAVAADNKERWHSGPLAVSTRVEANIPPENLGGVTSARVVADVIVTKDGVLEIDSRLANDAIRKVGGAPATYAYKVTIDGQDVYTQAEATQIQYTAWVRRNGRAKDGPMPERPLLRPDYDLLVRGGFTLPWDRALPPSASTYKGYVQNVIDAWTPKANDAYPAWGINRSAGAVGGRQEIGYRTYACMLWLKSGDPAAQLLAHRQLEVGMSRPQNLWDQERGTWVTIEDWPAFTSWAAVACPLDVPREKATGLPPDQPRRANDRDHVTVDHAHNADYWSVVAVLSGRRMAFDGMAMNAAWQTMDHNDRQRPEDAGQRGSTQGLKPDYTTGVAWAPRLGAPQTRGYAWALRDVCLAAALLPDNYPRRDYYNRNALAYINSYGVNLAALAQQQGELEGYVPHTNIRTHTSGYMNSFVIYAALDALNLGVAGPLGPAVVEHFCKFRINAFNTPDFNWRNAASGRDIFIGDGTNLFTKWSQAQARHVEKNADIDPQWSKTWPGEGDWQRNVLAGLALLRDAPLPLAMRAKAADAMVLYRSERQHGPEGMPRITPEAFFGLFENLNSLCPHGSTWRWDVPPVIRAGLSFRVSNPAVGDIVGLLVTDGGLPRASKPEGSDAFVIVEQPADNPFAVSRGGALKVAGKVPVGTHLIKVYATTYDKDGKEHRGPTVEVKVECIEGK